MGIVSRLAGIRRLEGTHITRYMKEMHEDHSAMKEKKINLFIALLASLSSAALL